MQVNFFRYRKKHSSTPIGVAWYGKRELKEK